MDKKLECEHEIRYRRAVGFGLHQYSQCIYAIVCLKCGYFLQ